MVMHKTLRPLFLAAGVLLTGRAVADEDYESVQDEPAECYDCDDTSCEVKSILVI